MPDQREEFARIIEDYLIRQDSGEAEDVDTLLNRYPHLKKRLREFFDAEDAMRQVAAEASTQRGGAAETLVVYDTRPEVPGFEVHEIVGRGGMGTVYRATNSRTSADVALKVLPPAFASSPSRVARFQREAEVASKLTEAHILPVHDLLQTADGPVLVMAYVDGRDLGNIIRQRIAIAEFKPPADPHPWAVADVKTYVEHVLRLFDQMVAALVAIHEAGVLHRDVKPSNILVGPQGDAWLSDFGLARVGEDSQMTVAGEMFGTVGFSSPEQSSGDPEAVDARSDLFSLGVTIYQTLTLKLPYDTQRVNELDPPAPPLSRLQPMISRDFDAVLSKVLEPDREKRYQTSREFAEDWGRVRQGLLPTAKRIRWPQRAQRWMRRNPWIVTTSALVVVLLAIVASLIPKPAPSLTVILPTKPQANAAILIPIDAEDGSLSLRSAIHPAGQNQSGFVFSDVPPGNYLVEVAIDEQRFHQVYRRVPNDSEVSGSFWHKRWRRIDEDHVELCTVRIPDAKATKGMALFEGSDNFRMGSNRLHSTSEHNRKVSPFYLGTSEVTVDEYRSVVMKHLKSAKPSRDGHLPMTDVTLDQAIQYAEMTGRRLPNEAEYEFAATAGGTRDFPWGNDSTPVTLQSFGRTGEAPHDVTNTTPPVRGLYSGVTEWTTSWGLPYPTAPQVVIDHAKRLPDFQNLRVIRGGPMSISQGLPAPRGLKDGPRNRYVISKNQPLPGLGFRCARSKRPDYLTIPRNK